MRMRKRATLTAVSLATVVTLTGCGGVSWDTITNPAYESVEDLPTAESAEPAPEQVAEVKPPRPAPVSAHPTTSDLATGSLSRDVPIGGQVLQLNYSTPDVQANWTPESGKSMIYSVSVIDPDQPRNVSLWATISATDSTGQPLEVSHVGIKGDYAVVAPYSFSETVNFSGASSEAEGMYVRFVFDTSIQTFEKSSAYFKQTAADTIWIAFPKAVPVDAADSLTTTTTAAVKKD